MDHRRENHHHHPRQQLHHHQHQHRQQQQHHHHQPRYHHHHHIINSPPPSPPPPPPSSSRYFPLHPHPPPPPLPPPSFPENNPSFLPPQQQHHHRPSFLTHQKPLNDFTFVDSSPRHHYRDAIYQSPPRVLHPTDRPLLYDSHDHNHTHPDDVVMDRPRFHLNELPRPPFPPPARVPPLSPIARRSPTRFVPFDGFSRQFDREDFNVDPRVRSQQHPDEFHMRRDRVDDNRRIIDRVEGDFDPNWDRNRDLERHERYYPELVLRKEFELNSGNSEYEPMPLNDEDLTRGGRRDNSNVGFEGNVNTRFGGAREVSRSPIKFRIGGGEGDDRFGTRGRKEEEYNNHGNPRKNLQKKSAFLRIQEVKPQHYTSNFRNRFDNSTTPSPHKGKESNSERVDNRVSEERVGSPVELDVSFKSNALVAKAIMAGTSCSGVEANVNNALSDSGTRIDCENPSKVASPKLKSVVSVREDKDSKNRVRVSPIMKRVGNLNNVEVRGSESSPGGSSSLSGGLARKASSKGKALVKDDKNAGFEKVSTPLSRKKRKITSQVSPLSSPMPSKTDSELVNVDSSASHLSDGSMPSGLSVKQSAKALLCGGNVIGSNQNECVDTGNFDINESPTVVDQEEIMDQSVSEESAFKRMREAEILESYPDSSRSLGSGDSDGHGNTKAFLLDEQRVSNPDKNVTKAVEKCGSDNHCEEISVKGQDMAAVFVDNCSVEGSSELARVCMGDHVDSNDICPGSVDTVNSVAVLSFIPNTDHVTTNIKDEVDLMCPIIDGAEPCETRVFPSPENTTIGLSLGGLYSDRKYEPELRHSENNPKLVSFANDADKPCQTKLFSSPENVTIGLSLGGLYSDNYENELGHSKDIASMGSFSIVGDKRTSHCSDDDFNIVLKNTNTANDVRVTDDIQEQQYQGLDTMLGNHDTTSERDEAPTTYMLPLSVEADSSLVIQKRKVGFEPDSLDSRVYESYDESVRSLNIPVENAMFPVQICCSTVSGSPSVEPKFSKGNGCDEIFLKGMDSLNGIDDLDRVEYSSGIGKKRKVLPLKSVFCDAPGSESSDLSVSAMTLLPAADGAFPQLAEGFEPKSTIAGEGGAGGATDSLYVEACSFTDKSKSDFLCKDSCLSRTESALPDAEQSNLPESRCNQKKIGNLMTAEASDDNAFIALESTQRMATSDGNSGLPCLSADNTGDVDQGVQNISTESDDNRMEMTDGNSGLPCSSTDFTGDVDQGPLVMNMECDDNRIATDNKKSVLPCLLVDHIGDVNEGSLAVNMEYAGNMALNANPSSLSGCVQSCAESMHGVTTNSDMLNTPSIVGLPGDRSLFISTSDISNDIPAIHVISGEKQSMDDKNSNQFAATQTSIPSEVNLLPETHKDNPKPGISASLAVQPFARKSLLLPSKNVNTTVSSSNSMSRLRKNVVTRSEAIPSTSQNSPVVNPSNKPHTFQAKPRTWRRTNNFTASNVPVKKPAVGPQPRPLYVNAMKVQDTSYIRKGNSLVRNLASGASTSGSHAFGASTSGSHAFGASTSGSHACGASIDRSKPNDSYRTRNIAGPMMPEPTELPDGLENGGRSAPIEMPKTPPLSCSGTGQDNDVVYSGGCTSSLPVDQSGGTDNGEAMKPSDSPLNSSRDTENVANRSLEDPGVFSDGDLLGSNSKRMIYIKRKSNQLIAASKSSQLSVHNMGKTAASSSDKNYYKRRKNQIIRASSDGNIQQMVAVVKNNSKSLSQRAPHTYYGRSSTKRPSNKAKSSKFSLVWKLGDSKSSGKGVDALRSRKLLSHLLPWKRATYWSRKLLSSRKRGAVYVRSGRGFSLRRSKVTSLPGTSLKWSKSMEKRSKKVEEEAALAISASDSVQKSGSSGVNSNAANGSNFLHKHKVVPGLKLHPGERIFRIGVFRYRMDPSRRALQRISDEEASDFTPPKTEKDARKTYVPKRLLIGSDEYVRIGNGNQLVRDPKRRTRILASEKVRWSLHTARMRLAKKRKFCQFFTRFGKCNKGEGKCPYIHDPSKIAVCTKFLNGLCAGSNCKLTHEVIPERMPDCSFYLQGLCSNENCPYRHVNVNPKASICENFLRGYCAEGNECRKKHSYICPEFEASGSCPQGSKCKLYHPKNAKAKKRRKGLRDQNNAKGRYFGSDLSVIADPESSPIIDKTVETSFAIQGELGDFISLDVGDSEELENGLASEQTSLGEDDPMNSQLDDLDEMIKPLSILGCNLEKSSLSISGAI